jgi:hypothetical protein
VTARLSISIVITAFSLVTVQAYQATPHRPDVCFLPTPDNVVDAMLQTQNPPNRQSICQRTVRLALLPGRQLASAVKEGSRA